MAKLAEVDDAVAIVIHFLPRLISRLLQALISKCLLNGTQACLQLFTRKPAGAVSIHAIKQHFESEGFRLNLAQATALNIIVVQRMGLNFSVLRIPIPAS